VHGPYNPASGQRCNPAKLLLDPYAKAIDGQIDGDESLFSYRFNEKVPKGGTPTLNTDDSLGHTMTSVVINPFFDWGQDRAPRHEYHETVIYEAHVKGLTQQHPGIPDEIRGTYAGIAHPAVIEHLKALGVTAIELMPVHQFVQDPHLLSKGLSNYWGYNTIGFLAPHNGYAAYGTRGQQVPEFKSMVKSLHEANIEVILDVVYNHTAEGNHLGPTLAFRGIDNAAYYRLVDDDKTHYFDTTGHRQQPADAPPTCAAADHGLAALLGHRDARRRIPLRPRVLARPPVPRGRPAVGLLRPRPAGPDRVAGQADRRAVGRRRRRLPGRQLPAAVDRVERQVP
jgi:glycogen operon protein